jgi:hypothetical protein
METPGQRRMMMIPGAPPSGGAEGSLYTTDPSLTDPKFYRVELLRRRLREVLWSVQLGLTGGEDRDPNRLKKTTTAPAPPPGTAAKGPAGPTSGVWAVAKAAGKEQLVDDVYFGVRKLVETVETKPTDLASFEKTLRREMAALEAVTGKPAAIAPPAASEGAPAEIGPGGPVVPGPAVVPTAVVPTAAVAAPPAGK